MQTNGQYRVGTTFNPSSSDLVNEIKSRAAEFIDLIEMIPTPTEGPEITKAQYRQVAEIIRGRSNAMNAIESAAMWAVKAATKPEPEED
tara:strand:- start:3000 stop:3266 length:267 start_codon:yes stop_codon:yes gene_type:complete